MPEISRFLGIQDWELAESHKPLNKIEPLE